MTVTAEQSGARDLTRQAVVLGGAIAEILAAAWVVGAGTNRFAEPAAGGNPPLIPSGYAFAIWTPIYLGMLLYGVYQLLPAARHQAIVRVTGWPAAAAMWGAAAWVLVAQREERVWLTVAILATITAALALAHRALKSAPPRSRAELLLVRAPLGLFFGWACVATFANIASAIRIAGLTAPGAETVPSLLMLAGATIATVAITRSMPRNWWYVGAVTWALVAIAVANLQPDQRPFNPVVGAGAIMAAVAIVIVAWRQPRSAG